MPCRKGRNKEYLWTLNFGPQHPATHTTLRLILTLDGETVVKAVPDIGYLHSGFEKLGEDLDFNQYVTIVDRMNYISPIANEIAWHHAVEKLMGIELDAALQVHPHHLRRTDRASAITCSAAARRPSISAASRRSCMPSTSAKRSTTFSRRAAGQRFHPSYTRVGGLLFDVIDDFDRARSAPSSRVSRRRMPNDVLACSIATASSSSAPGTSAC